eukprot:366331-Chlamydomonas_euryale.AAC.21
MPGRSGAHARCRQTRCGDRVPSLQTHKRRLDVVHATHRSLAAIGCHFRTCSARCCAWRDGQSPRWCMSWWPIPPSGACRDGPSPRWCMSWWPFPPSGAWRDGPSPRCCMA